MKLRIVVLTAAAVSVTALSAALLLPRVDLLPRENPTSGPDAATTTSERRAADTFIGVTAAHLCNVQSTVYDDPSALAKAYNAIPAYPGITADQVTAFRHRLSADPQFSARLTTALRATCRATKPGGAEASR